MTGDVERRDAEADDEEDENERRAAEDVRVDDRDRTQREGSPPRQAADDREHEREDEHERLGDHHQLDVGLEAVPDLGHRAEEVERAEERVQELPHARPPPAASDAYLQTGIVYR